MTIFNAVIIVSFFGVVCILIGFTICYVFYDYECETVENIEPEHHFFDYDLSKQDFVITGDRHADTIEKSFSKNEVKHPEEYWKYTFEDGGSEKSDHPLSNEEMKPLVNIHGPVKQDGLEVIKV